LFVQERDFGSGVEKEQVPPATVEGAANGRAELLEEEILIANRLARPREQAHEGDAAPPEIELETKLLEQVRAEQKVHLEFLLARDHELHLVVRHDGDRHSFDPHSSDI